MVKRGGSESRKAGGGAHTPPPDALDFAQVLTIADALPMAIAFVDPQLTYRFANKALADFLERPRGKIIGRTLDEVLPPQVMAARRPMLDAALAGERQWFAADFPHPSRGNLAIQTEYLPQLAPDGRLAGIIIIV